MKNNSLKKIVISLLLIFVTGFAALFAVSHLVYNRSVVATVVSMYIKAVDRNAMFAEEAVCLSTIEERAVTNLQDIETPEMEVSVTSRRENRMQVIYLNEESLDDTVIVYFHGGAFMNPPVKEHWKFLEELALKTEIPVILPVYLKATNYSCDEAYEEMLRFYGELCKNKNIKNIYFVGDSSGGGFALSLAQQLRYTKLPQPSKLVLICPWTNLAMDNPDIASYIDKDVMLGLPGLKILAGMWAGERQLTDSIVSPFYGSFENLGTITLFSGTREILYPDTLLLAEKLNDEGADYSLHIGEGMGHVYPLLPIPEASEAMDIILEALS